MNVTMAIPRHLLLTSNQRLHWATKAKRTKALRWRGYQVGLDMDQMQKTHLTVFVHWPDNRRRDEMNLAPTLKACIDGMVDAGVLPDDSGDYLIGPDYRRGPNMKLENAVVVLDFQFEAVT